MLGSFKFKLIAAFLVLSLVPLAAAYSSYSDAAARSVARSVDGRLEAGLRAAVAAYGDERRTAQAAAERLARTPALQAAVARRDRAALERLLRPHANVRVEADDGFAVGPQPPTADRVTVSLVGAGTRAASVVAWIPLDERLLDRLHARSGLTSPDQLALVAPGGEVAVASTGAVRGRLVIEHGRVAQARIGSETFRVAGIRLVVRPGFTLAAATPTSSLAALEQSAREHALAALVVALLLITIVAYVVGRSIVGSLGRLVAAANSIAAGRLQERVPVHGKDEFGALARTFNRMASELEARVRDLEGERQRLREANKRLGDALAATLDPQQLTRVIVETAVEATHAKGALLYEDDGRVVFVTGDVSAGESRLEFPLIAGRQSYGSIVLVGDDFDEEAPTTAAALAAQAVIALDNARVHRVVEQQALFDELTGLANRRQAEEALTEELVRAERLGGSVGFILADLDDFKQINDRHGHPTGDAALVAAADALRSSLREIDLPARWGGEEFAVVLPGTDVAGAVEAGERLRAALATVRVSTPAGGTVSLTASFGVVAAEAGSSRAAIVQLADEALYRAKRSGKDSVEAAVPLAHAQQGDAA